ncbi:translational GTPase TypA [Candidatus Magnetaquicoccus inordinatus]|uniref:translational GTPase TypA n=1 Tax=Candidatus Magnetaquicoccus inordinatus TaxID=2496818 RepID=UPI00102B902C|nr:translational GTPase TypA [Candidatus Magnetaquicoccus inordinatus]
MIQHLRNIAIIAHVDHGKTTLVDKLLQQSGTLSQRGEVRERIMDSNDQERERGITILAKNTAIQWGKYRINIVDTPGHADFGGEVERVLSMVDSVLLLVDAVDGPMPQTRFVTRKAFDMGFRPIVVINKVDRPSARPLWVLDQTFELFDKLGASDEQLDFPVIYASALAGFASLDAEQPGTDMTPLFETIVREVNPPLVDPEGPFQMQVSALDYNSYVGLIGIGRIKRGSIRSNSPVTVIAADDRQRPARILQIFGFLGLERVEVAEAFAGEIIAFTGVEKLGISDTLCHPEGVEALPSLAVDEPTISMMFQVNDSPFAGKEGKFVTSRQLRERLFRELEHNVALRVEETEHPDRFRVSGRGELHLGVLIETMRREGFEMGVSRPEVIVRERDGLQEEPYETLVIDVEESYQGGVMEALGQRRAALQDMASDGSGRVRLDYVIPARGLIGFQTEFRTITSGTGLMYHVFDHYGPICPSGLGQRKNGVLIAREEGKATAYALWNLQERGRHFIGPGAPIYEGLIIGMHNRNNDLVVNPLKGKQLTNIRASGADEAIILTPPIRLSLEQALEFINNDELVEVTPHSIRLRKRLLKEHERKRYSKEQE